MGKSSEHMQEIQDHVVGAVDALPNPPREAMKRELAKIKEIVMDGRPPRVMIVGRRGAGKSSLINAIFGSKVAEVGAVVSETGAPMWHSFQTAKGAMKILDTRGLGDRTRPESANFENALDEIKDAVRKQRPDAVLFLCKAKEADAHISADVASVAEIRAFIKSAHNYEIPVAAVVTQVDELDPKRVEPPYDDPTKAQNILTAVGVITDALEDQRIELTRVIPVSAYAEYGPDGQLTYQNYWNVDMLLEYLVEVLPNDAQLELARLSAFRSVQVKLARTLTGATATVCAGLAAVPVPVADLLPITGAQFGMLIGIGHIAGRELSKEAVKEFLVALGLNVGAGFALREAARALAKVAFPGAGSAISAGVAFAGTWGIGEAGIKYFIEGGSIEEAKGAFETARSHYSDPRLLTRGDDKSDD